jgi:hypothetical protein
MKKNVKKLSEFESKCDAKHFLYDDENARIDYKGFFIYCFEDCFYFEEEGKWHYPPVSSFDGALFYIDMVDNLNKMVEDSKKGRVFNENEDKRAKIRKLYDYGYNVGHDLAEYFDTLGLSDDDLVELCIQKEKEVGEFFHNSVYYTDGVIAGIFHYLKERKKKNSA